MKVAPLAACLPACILALAAAAPLRAGAEPAVYLLDPAHSFVHFELLHFGTSTIRGRIGPVQGAVTLDRAAGHGELGLRIATASISTGIPVFDARIREGDLLATQAQPEAFFVATHFRFEGDRLAEVRGEFTLRGVSRPLSLRARHFGCRMDASGAAPVQVCGGDFDAEFDRSAFGITFGLPFVADTVRLVVSVEGRRR
jgi:polyisoprenoid-binding protein YceI